MNFWDTFIYWLTHPTWQSEIIIAAAMCLVLCIVFKKRNELSRHALENTATTLVLAGFNMGVAIFFLNDVNAFAQSSYEFLRIPTLNPKIWDSVPLWIICLFGVAAKDFVDYWNHRLMHTKWGWPTHAAHHSDTHVNAFTANRVHFLEALLMTVSYILLLTWLQIPQALPFVIVFYILHNKYVHMDLDFEHGSLKYLIASPVYHRWHHADVPEAYGKNLANVMPIYDVMFGTFYSPGKCDAPMGALATGVEDKSAIAIMTYPFREWTRMIKESRKQKASKAKVIPAE
ncbi:MAG: sterol desaturase/sphingolipid hydroxylase (fatty acid hydroxylase superfamily) [Ascidiaceihabitans sp.]|jgi:sterol desaturase/sphingolipid hydroxylase (fatty acid hydroxylase superfamily)